jgi:hypothetical protein
MRKNVTLGALAALLLALVYSDIIVRRGEDGWCAWWRSNVKVCSVNVDHVADPSAYATVYYTNVKPGELAAVCSTDSDCAAWEVRTNVPLKDRVYGAPVPASKMVRR